jgi:hypothetical protein
MAFIRRIRKSTAKRESFFVCLPVRLRVHHSDSYQKCIHKLYSVFEMCRPFSIVVKIRQNNNLFYGTDLRSGWSS